MDYILLNIQLALFFDREVAHPEEFVDAVSNGLKWGGQRQINRVSEDAAFSSVPIAVVFSDDGRYRVEISRSKLNLICDGRGRETFQQRKEEFLELAKVISQIVLPRMTRFLSRVGLSRIVFFESSSGEDEIKKYIQLDKFSSTHMRKGEVYYDTAVSVTTRFVIDEFTFNNISTVTRGSATLPDGSQLVGLIITRDVNTIPDPKDPYYIDKDGFSAILKTISGVISEDL